MSIPLQKYVGNSLLSILPPDDYAVLAAVLEPVQLQRKDVLIRPDEPIPYVHFMQSGVASVIAGTADGRRIEIGIVGSEGFVGTALMHDIDRVPHETFIQIEGEALRINRSDFCRLTEQRPILRALLLRYAHVFHLHTAQTALSNGSYTLEERLARWLLMCHDRISGDSFPVTHEFLSMMLGVHRPGVTTTIHILEGAGMIKGRRSHMEIVDRDKLRATAGHSYGVAEAEYRRLITDGRSAASPIRAEPDVVRERLNPATSPKTISAVRRKTSTSP